VIAGQGAPRSEIRKMIETTAFLEKVKAAVHVGEQIRWHVGDLAARLKNGIAGIAAAKIRNSSERRGEE